MILSHRRLRILIDPADPTVGRQMIDKDSGEEIRIVRGDALDLEIAVLKRTATFDFSEIDSIQATFKNSQTDTGVALANSQVDAVDLNTGITLGEFLANRSAEPWLARFQYTGGQMAWAMAGEPTRTAWLSIYANLSDGSVRLLGMSGVTMENGNTGAADVVLPSSIFTVTNNELRVLCPDGVTRRVLLSDL